uniref:hypothetical protein n=1 Tax=Phenylobacterium sp. TaxID=1871053 RepID=UPI00286B73D7
EIEHVVLAYGLSVLMAASFPRVHPYLFAAGIAAAGAGLEISQALGWISGGYELRDALSNAAGALAAILPIAIQNRRVGRR